MVTDDPSPVEVVPYPFEETKNFGPFFDPLSRPPAKHVTAQCQHASSTKVGAQAEQQRPSSGFLRVCTSCCHEGGTYTQDREGGCGTLLVAPAWDRESCGCCGTCGAPYLHPCGNLGNYGTGEIVPVVNRTFEWAVVIATFLSV